MRVLLLVIHLGAVLTCLGISGVRMYAGIANLLDLLVFAINGAMLSRGVSKLWRTSR